MKEKTNAGVHTKVHMAFETQCLADARDGGGSSAFKRELQHKFLVIFSQKWWCFLYLGFTLKIQEGFLNSSHGIYFDSASGCHHSSDYVWPICSKKNKSRPLQDECCNAPEIFINSWPGP